MSAIKNIFKSNSIRWIALCFLVVPMFASYFFDDMFSTLSHLFSNPQLLELGWSSEDYGFYAGGYSFLCVFGGLIFCGILLDVYGIRKMGSFFMGLMFVGALVVSYAISSGLPKNQALSLAYIGCMLFGLGSEIGGVAVSRSIAKWFKNKNIALAMGLQLAIARLGTAAAFIISPILVSEKASYYPLSETSKPAFFGLILIFAGLLLWGFFVFIDYKRDSYIDEEENNILSEKSELKGNIVVEEKNKLNKKSSLEDKFKFSDLRKLLTNPRFLMIAILCVSFYCCIISFKKFGTAILIPRFNLDVNKTKWMLSMIPFSTVIFTPIFGALVDRIGKATWWMLGGSCIVLIAHLIIAFSQQGTQLYGFAGIILLGLGLSIVPSAMWPSVPKIVPERNLGTAFSLLYWIQNMGMLSVPMLIGRIYKNSIISDTNNIESQQLFAALHSEYIFIALAIVAIIIALLLKREAKLKPELNIDKANIG